MQTPLKRSLADIQRLTRIRSAIHTAIYHIREIDSENGERAEGDLHSAAGSVDDALAHALRTALDGLDTEAPTHTMTSAEDCQS
jgi:hypothetical protein